MLKFLEYLKTLHSSLRIEVLLSIQKNYFMIATLFTNNFIFTMHTLSRALSFTKSNHKKLGGLNLLDLPELGIIELLV